MPLAPDTHLSRSSAWQQLTDHAWYGWFILRAVILQNKPKQRRSYSKWEITSPHACRRSGLCNRLTSRKNDLCSTNGYGYYTHPDWCGSASRTLGILI